ncbi:MAG: histidine phosphatase family protein [Candidatus Heimdallarchaeota archaeon]
MQILLVRHGESTGNLNRIFQGQGAFPLTNKGKIQAVLAAKEIKDNFTSICCIYSSDLVRAKESTEIISNILDIKDITYDQRLREHNCGVLEGKVFSEELKEKYLTPGMKDHDLRIPEGESRNEMNKRIRESFEEIVTKTNKKDTVMIITHGGVLGRLLKTILNLVPEDKNFENCKVNLIERKTKTDNWKLLLCNGENYLE